MENQHHIPWEQWLDRATAGIRFKPDREEVRAELSAHLEDKALDFQRIFPGLRRRSGKSWPGFTSPGWGTCGGPVRGWRWPL